MAWELGTPPQTSLSARLHLGNLKPKPTLHLPPPWTQRVRQASSTYNHMLWQPHPHPLNSTKIAAFVIAAVRVTALAHAQPETVVIRCSRQCYQFVLCSQQWGIVLDRTGTVTGSALSGLA